MTDTEQERFELFPNGMLFGIKDNHAEGRLIADSLRRLDGESIVDMLNSLNLNSPQQQEGEDLNRLAERVVEMCKKREWSLHWTHRGAYLHLESSELIEAIRGKHGDPQGEAADVFLVLLSITEYAGIPFSEVIETAAQKLKRLETTPPYPGEERGQAPQQPETDND